jgi:two-component system, OmpR family, response regulator
MIEAAKIALVGKAPGLAEFLERQGFAVERLADPADGRTEGTRAFDLFLVQTDHLTAETLDLCQRSAGAGAAPCVLIVSGAANDEERIQALEAGAADCLAEPLNLREVRARVRAVLRRLQRPKPVTPGWAFGGWRLDPARRELRAPNGVGMVLPPGEFALLRSFVSEPQHLLSRAALQRLSSLSEQVLDVRVMDVRIARLRARFTRAGCPDFIQTVRGEGYLFATPVQTLD